MDNFNFYLQLYHRISLTTLFVFSKPCPVYVLDILGRDVVKVESFLSVETGKGLSLKCVEKQLSDSLKRLKIHIYQLCWVSADRVACYTASQEIPLTTTRPPVQEIPYLNVHEHTNIELKASIILPGNLRTIVTQSKCFIGGSRKERNRVPISITRMLESKYYVADNNHLCDQNEIFETWDFFNGLLNNFKGLLSNFVQTFTARQIRDTLSLKGGFSNYKNVKI